MKILRNLTMLFIVMFSTSLLVPNETQAERKLVYYNLYNADLDAFVVYDTNSGLISGHVGANLDLIEEFSYPDAVFYEPSIDKYYVVTSGKVNGVWIVLTGYYDKVNQWPPES